MDRALHDVLQITFTTLENKTMIEYTVVYAHAMTTLADQVERMMKLGWMVTGGIAVCGAPMYAGFYQAMLKITPEDLAEDPCGS